MDTLLALKRFALACYDLPEEEQAPELASYVSEHEADISEACGITVESLRAAVSDCPPDKLCGRILATVDGTRKRGRESVRAEKDREATVLADEVCADGAPDTAKLFRLATVAPGDAIAFAVARSAFTVTRAQLRAVAQLRRRDMVCTVSERGLHFTWNGGKGRLRFGVPIHPDHLTNFTVVRVPNVATVKFAA